MRRIMVNAKQTIAERILFLERELAAISARQGELATRKETLRAELTSLRCGMTARDAAMLERLRLEAMAR